jgi:type IV pilus assembly protein PilO
MKQLLEQFKFLNPKDPGSWPPLPKAVALLVLLIGIIVGAYFGDWAGQIEELDAGAAAEVKLKDDYVKKKQQSVNLDLYQQQLREIDSSFGALLKQLPNRSQMDALLVDINQAGLGRGLQFELFRPGQVEVKDYYAELPIAIKVSGRYNDMGAFAADVANLSRIVTLHNLSIAPLSARDTSGNLTMEATARTYRYLDAAEVADQKKAAAEKAAKAAGAKK